MIYFTFLKEYPWENYPWENYPYYNYNFKPDLKFFDPTELKGETGDKGEDGIISPNYKKEIMDNINITRIDGKSSYDIWRQNNEGTETEYKNFIKGNKGDKGSPGNKGIIGSVGPIGKNADPNFYKGETGPTGPSDFENWTLNNQNKSYSEYINKMKGERGNDGDENAFKFEDNIIYDFNNVAIYNLNDKISFENGEIIKDFKVIKVQREKMEIKVNLVIKEKKVLKEKKVIQVRSVQLDQVVHLVKMEKKVLLEKKVNRVQLDQLVKRVIRVIKVPKEKKR